MNDLLEAALEYAARGWPVFPLHTPTETGGCSCGSPACDNQGKHPRTLHGLNDASTDERQIRVWWKQWPTANIGVATGPEMGVVLDVDGAAGRDWAKERGVPVDAVCQQTGRKDGGWQIMFAWPGFTVGNATGTATHPKFPAGIDIRGQGGYVVAPPSLHKSGKHYRWITEGTPGPAPEWLLNLLKPTNGNGSIPTASGRAPDAYLQAALDGETDLMRQQRQPGRNVQLYVSAKRLGRLEAAGLSRLLAEDMLVTAAMTTGLEERECIKTFASGWEAGEAEPRSVPEGERWSFAHASPPVDEPPPIDPFFIEWSTFWGQDDEIIEWLHEDILARGRGHALYATHKVGKSLLMLYVAAQLATGAEPVVVVYLDYEMTEADIHDRLDDMGYGPATDLSRLKYALLPFLLPLDTAAGADQLMEVLDGVETDYPDHHMAVVIDTISRAVKGEENDSDTFRDFYFHTGIRLKRRGITWARLDHGGKDPRQGQRGSSGKGDDVDVVWKLTKTENGIALVRDVARMNWIPEKVVFRIHEEPLRYMRVLNDPPEGVDEVMGLLVSLNVPFDASTREAQKILRAAGEGRRRVVINAALKQRSEAKMRREPL